MNGQTSLDYLDQIAPAAPAKKPVFQLNIKTILLAALAVITLIIIAVNISSAVANSKLEPWQRLYLRINATKTIVDSSSNKIKNSSLRGMNSDLKLYITNTTGELTGATGPIAKLGINVKKIPASVTAKEDITKAQARLEDGRLNAKYDSTYAREMTYQVATLLALIKQLYNTNVSDSTKTLLKGWYENLQPTYKTLKEFSASNE